MPNTIGIYSIINLFDIIYLSVGGLASLTHTHARHTVTVFVLFSELKRQSLVCFRLLTTNFFAHCRIRILDKKYTYVTIVENY